MQYLPADKLQVREMLSPAKPPQQQETGDSKAPAPAAQNAKTRLIEAELRQKFGEEVRWHKKQADHLTVELDTARAKRKDLEAELARTKADLERQLADALAENEDLLCAGGGQRGPRAELEASRKELAGVRKELEALQARWADGGEARRIHAGELRDTRERLSAAQAEAQELRETLKRVEAKYASKLAKAIARAERAENEACGKAELTAQVAALVAKSQEGDAEYAHVSTRVQQAEHEAAAAHERLVSLEKESNERVLRVEQEAVQAKACASEAQARAEEEERRRVCMEQEAEAAQRQVMELQAQLAAEKDKKSNARQQAREAGEEVKKAQAYAAKQQTRADGLAAQLAKEQGAAEGAKAAASASQALSKCQRELMELQAEYNRAVYDMAKARAERSEMCGTVAKTRAESVNLQQQLAAAHLALTEVHHIIHLSSDDASLRGKQDQDQDLKLTPTKSGLSALPRLQLERVKKIVEAAEEERRALSQPAQPALFA